MPHVHSSSYLDIYDLYIIYVGNSMHCVCMYLNYLCSPSPPANTHHPYWPPLSYSSPTNYSHSHHGHPNSRPSPPILRMSCVCLPVTYVWSCRTVSTTPSPPHPTWSTTRHTRPSVGNTPIPSTYRYLSWGWREWALINRPYESLSDLTGSYI